MALDFIFKRDKKISAIFVTKQGRIIKFNAYPDSDTFSYNNGSYVINKDARLTCNGQPSFIYIEGIADPLNMNNIKKPSDIKLDSEGLKSVLKAKLFYDLFYDGSFDTKDIIVLIGVGLCLLAIIIIGVMLNNHIKATGVLSDMLYKILDAQGKI